MLHEWRINQSIEKHTKSYHHNATRCHNSILCCFYWTSRNGTLSRHFGKKWLSRWFGFRYRGYTLVAEITAVSESWLAPPCPQFSKSHSFLCEMSAWRADCPSSGGFSNNHGSASSQLHHGSRWSYTNTFCWSR